MKYKTNQVRNTKLKKKKTNNAYLMSQNHHQILENDRLPMERERERDCLEKNQYKGNKEQIKKKKKQTNKETNVNQYLLIGKQRGYKEK